MALSRNGKYPSKISWVDFIKGLKRLWLSHWLKSEPFDSAKSSSQMAFTEGISGDLI